MGSKLRHMLGRVAESILPDGSDSRLLARVSAHVEAHLGAYTLIHHPSGHAALHVDLLAAQPDGARSWRMLVTSGMAEYPLPKPPGRERQPRYVELAVALPPAMDIHGLVPIIEALAHYPHDHGQWLGPACVIPIQALGLPAEAARPGAAALVTPVFGAPAPFEFLEWRPQDAIRFLGVQWLLPAEWDHAQTHGGEKLLDRFHALPVEERIRPDRPALV